MSEVCAYDCRPANPVAVAPRQPTQAPPVCNANTGHVPAMENVQLLITNSDSGSRSVCWPRDSASRWPSCCTPRLDVAAGNVPADVHEAVAEGVVYP
eukprot:SAG25_NODE_10786_length_322_cov_1.475336_1_plen_96_part_10